MPRRMQVNKGFTLIELLAVLIIIAIIALITTPTILGVINDSNEKAFLDTAYTINKAATNYYTKSVTSNNYVPLLITYENGKIKSSQRVSADGTSEESDENYLEYSGNHPYSGNVYISKTGEIEMAIYDNRSSKCAEKKASDKLPTITQTSKENCKLDKTIP